MKRVVYNFSPGLAVLSKEVIQQAADEMTDWRGGGLSVMAMSHRGKEFTEILAAAKADLRELMSVLDNYKILFMQGGAIAENAIVPMNLIDRKPQPVTIDFINTVHWTVQSIAEVHKYAKVNAASAEDAGFTYVPAHDTWKLSRDAAYVHGSDIQTIFLEIMSAAGRWNAALPWLSLARLARSASRPCMRSLTMRPKDWRAPSSMKSSSRPKSARPIPAWCQSRIPRKASPTARWTVCCRRR